MDWFKFFVVISFCYFASGLLQLCRFKMKSQKPDNEQITSDEFVENQDTHLIKVWSILGATFGLVSILLY